jgi:hypothetical protein
MTHVNMVKIELNKINNNINIHINNNNIEININNSITLLNHKISHKMMMPCKLVLMDEMFM